KGRNGVRDAAMAVVEESQVLVCRPVIRPDLDRALERRLGILDAAGVVVGSRKLAGCIRTARLQVERALETGDRLRAFAGDAVKQTHGHVRHRQAIVELHRAAGAEARGWNEGGILQALELA